MFLKTLRRILLIVFMTAAAAYLLYQGFLFWRAQDRLPPGTVIAGVAVEHLTVDEARLAIAERYLRPLVVYNGDERVAELLPQDVGFSIDLDGMLAQAAAAWNAQETWRKYAEFVIGISPRPINVELQAAHDEAALSSRLAMIADFVDRPATAPQLLVSTGKIKPGEPGRITDRETSLNALRSALYQPDERRVDLTMIDQPAEEWGMSVLEEAINNLLAQFDGFGSIFILDLQTGEELSINGDVALSGLSILKIPIFVEAYRALDGPPNAYEQDLFLSTATASSNHSANLLLHVIAGEDNTYRGADILTESMRRMGLVNTFMAVPYDAVAVSTRPSTFSTPANSRTDVNTDPDPTMQTTAEDIGTLLAMIYYCAEGEGGLLAVYPEEITQEECRAIVDLMIKNEEGNLIRYGVPEGVRVSHKHGWSFNEHGDAGIVYTPGGDYVIYTFLAQPESDWLMSDYSFPILREISRAAYNYFNYNDPYPGRQDDSKQTRIGGS